MILCGNSEEKIQKVKTELSREFNMKDLGPIRNFMGLRIEYDREKGILNIDQSNYIKQVLNKFDMIDCKPRATSKDKFRTFKKSIRFKVSWGVEV